MSTTMIIAIAVAVFIVDLAVIITLIRLKRKKMKLRESGISGSQSTSVQRIERGESGEGDVDGVRYQYEYRRGHSKRPPALIIRVPCVASAAFSIKRENGFDRWCKRIGIALEIETHDPEFDNTYYISSDYPDFAQQFFSMKRNREAVKRLFEFGFKGVALGKNEIIASWEQFRPTDPPAAETIRQMAAELAQLTHHLSSVPIQADFGWKKIRLFVFIFHGLALLTAIIAAMLGGINYTPLDGGTLFLQSLKVSIPLWLVSLWLSMQLLRGHSTSHHELLAVFFISLIGFPLAGFGYGATLNAWMDKSEPVYHTVTVTDKYITKNKNNKNYHMRVVSWREAPETESFGISRESYELIRPGVTQAIIRTKAGYFKYEWMLDYQLENP